MADLIANVSKDPLSYMTFLKDLQGAGYIDANIDLSNNYSWSSTSSNY